MQIRREHEHERDVIQAWNGVAIWVASHKRRGKESYLKVPELSTLLKRQRRQPSPQELRAQLYMLSDFLGKPIRKVKTDGQ